MVTRIKTVEYSFQVLDTLVNNTLTDFPSMTIVIPETVVEFVSVTAELTLLDTVTAAGGTFTKRLIALQLDANGYSTITNTSSLAHSSENIALFHTSNFTDYFNTYWSGTSMTCSARAHIVQSGTGGGGNNVCLKLIITYTYDSTSVTHVKTVKIPFNSTLAGLTIPLKTIDTVPNLSTFLPEDQVAITDCFLEIEGNSQALGSTDITFSGFIGTGYFVSQPMENALSSDRFFRYIWKAYVSGNLAFNSGDTNLLQLGSSVNTKMHHLANTLNVTYTFNSTGTTSVLNSVMLPLEFPSPMGGTTTSDAQKASRILWIQEPGTIEIAKSAFYLHWDQVAPIAGMALKINTQDYNTYTDIASMVCGGNSLQRTIDDNVTLYRGLNTLSASLYRTDTVDLGMNVCGYFLLNYYSDKHASGVSEHNTTFRYNITGIDVSSPSYHISTIARAPSYDSTDYFLNAIGTWSLSMSSTNSPQGIAIDVEKLTAEGGPMWENVYTDISHSDGEVGARYTFSQARSIFKVYAHDPRPGRIDLFTPRRWRATSAGGITNNWSLDTLCTIHHISYDITGVVSGFTGDGSDIDLYAYRVYDNELVLTGKTDVGGEFSLRYFDNTSPIFLSAKEGTRVGRSIDNTP